MLQRIENPDNVPGAVTTGYQRQNTNIFIIQTGLDTTEPSDNGGTVITIPAGGIVEANGVMFKVISQITLTKPVAARVYWIELNDTGATPTFTLVTTPGVWNSEKQGCYRTGNRRTLNWVSLGNMQTPPTTGAEWQSPTTKGNHNRQLPTGWKFARVRGGSGGGNGLPGTTAGAGGGGGVPFTPTEDVTIFFHKGGNVRVFIGAHGLAGSTGSGGDAAAGSGRGGGGGGGGGGSGEPTHIIGIFKSGAQSRGIGGVGGSSGGSGRGVGGGGGAGGDNYGAVGTIGSIGNEDGGIYIRGQGGTGGTGGQNGADRPIGSSGGYCNIFALGN